MSSTHDSIKTILELDLASYSDIARSIEENLDVHAVKQFEDQIQAFVDHGLNQLGLNRDEVVLGTAGDNAILVFDDPTTMHRFATAVQGATAEYNKLRSVESAKRWFRMGAATGTVLLLASERRIVGTTIARAVRLEAAANIGELLVDVPTFDALQDDVKQKYHEAERIAGKRDEEFVAYRCSILETDDSAAINPPKVRDDVSVSSPQSSANRPTSDRKSKVSARIKTWGCSISIAITACLLGAVLLLDSYMAHVWNAIVAVGERPPPPATVPWFPSEDFQAAEGAKLHKGLVNGQRVYDKIERVIPGNTKPVLFLLVYDAHSPAKPFYIMQDEVWSGLFRQFSDEDSSQVKYGADVPDPLIPAVNVTVNEAHRFAVWLGGRLPTVEEWNTAAGYYVWENNRRREDDDRVGPFRGKLPAGSEQQLQIAFNSNKPSKVGSSKDDVSVFGCRDMAGNVEELTCSLMGGEGFETVPVEHPPRSLLVQLRGKSFADALPMIYTDFSLLSVKEYSTASPYAGFRVMIEIKRMDAQDYSGS